MEGTASSIRLRQGTANGWGALRLSRSLWYLLILVPGVLVLDIANGALGEEVAIPVVAMTPGEIGRGGILIWAILTLARKRGRLYRPIQWFFVASLAIGLLGPVRAAVSGGELGSMVYDLEKLMKVLYGPALLALVVSIYADHRIRLRDVIFAVTTFGTLAAAALIFFDLAAIGIGTYREHSAAHLGLFIAQNDLGLAMALSLAAAMHQALDRPRYLVPVIIIITGMATLGTRTATLGAVGIPLIVLLFHHRRFRSWRALPKIALLSFILIAVQSVMAIDRYRTFSSEDYQARKYTAMLEGELTRVFLLAGALDYTANRDLTAQFVGDGASRFQRGVAANLPQTGVTHRASEVDWMDLFGAHGVLFASLIYLFYLWFLERALRGHTRELGILRWVIVLIIALYLLHATLAGHAMGNPLPIGVLAPILALIWILERSRSGRYRPGTVHPHRRVRALAAIPRPRSDIPAGG